MKLSSPFIDHIPECKRKMRRLRKKIYKYITSKNYKKPVSHKKDILTIFKQAKIPTFLQQFLTKKKSIDLNVLKNINVNSKLSISQVIAIASKQQANVKEQHSKWQIEESLKQKERQKKHFDFIQGKEIMSKRTISSTEYSQFDQDQYQSQPSVGEDLCQSFEYQLDDSSNGVAEFNPFTAGSRFLDMESSILSHENLFK